jgi:hypothetical protein
VFAGGSFRYGVNDFQRVDGDMQEAGATGCRAISSPGGVHQGDERIADELDIRRGVVLMN